MQVKRVASIELGAPGDIPIEVRVIRKWNPRYRPYITCYLFVDAHGDGLQAIERKKDQKHVEPKINIMMCYRIENYVCAPPEEYINVMSHPVNLLIGQAASITSIPDTNALPRQYFNFYSREELEPLRDKKEKFVDYIGLLEDIYDNTTKENDPFVNLTIQDTSDKEIVISLWKEIATSVDKFDRAAIEKSQYPAVIATTSMKVVSFLGQTQLSSTPATYVYLNPTTAEAESLITRFNNKSSNNPLQLQQNEKSTNLAVLGGNSITLASLLQKDQTQLNGKTFTCNAKIVEILTKKNWYYTGCPTCLQTIYKSGDQWGCPADGKFNSPKYMYCVIVMISDDTEKMTVTMFDEAVKSLVEMSCSDMVIKKAYTDTTTVPPLINKMRGETRKFYLQAKKDPHSKTIRCTVNKVTESDTITNTPATPTPPTPAPKRMLLQSPGDDILDTKRAIYPD